MSTNCAFHSVDKLDSVSRLSALSRYKEAVVVQVLKSNQALHQKLLSMGIVEGTKVKILARAPLGGPMNIKALGYQLSLRRSEADHIMVQAA